MLKSAAPAATSHHRSSTGLLPVWRRRPHRRATERAREYFAPYAPSSPQIALLKDGKVVFMLERKQIEGRAAEEIAKDLVEAFERHC